MDIVLIRHPKTIANESHIIYGRTDYPYAELGHRQFDWVVKKVEASYAKKTTDLVKRVLIHSSPRYRALNLAKGIAETIQIDYKVNERLAEMDFGIFEGMTLETVKEKYPEAYKDFTERFEETTIPEGESYLSFTERMDQFCDEVANLEKSKDIDELIVVSHGGVSRELLERLTGMIPGCSWSVQVGNGCIMTLTPSKEAYVIKELLNM